MMELEHLDNISSKNPTLRYEAKETNLDMTSDNLLSKPSFLIENSRSPKKKKAKVKRVLDSDVLQMLYLQSK